MKVDAFGLMPLPNCKRSDGKTNALLSSCFMQNKTNIDVLTSDTRKRHLLLDHLWPAFKILRWTSMFPYKLAIDTDDPKGEYKLVFVWWMLAIGMLAGLVCSTLHLFGLFNYMETTKAMGAKLPGNVSGILMVAILMPTINASFSTFAFALKAPAIKSIMMISLPVRSKLFSAKVNFIDI